MNKTRIMIVDDEAGLSHMVKLILEKTGDYVVKVENLGKRANESALEFKPHLILLDFCLLDTDGGTVAEGILADRRLKYTPIVFLTSLLSAEEAAKGMKLNGDIPILPKPFNAKSLIACIEDSLNAEMV